MSWADSRPSDYFGLPVPPTAPPPPAVNQQVRVPGTPLPGELPPLDRGKVVRAKRIFDPVSGEWVIDDESGVVEDFVPLPPLVVSPVTGQPEFATRAPVAANPIAPAFPVAASAPVVPPNMVSTAIAAPPVARPSRPLHEVTFDFQGMFPVKAMYSFAETPGWLWLMAPIQPGLPLPFLPPAMEHKFGVAIAGHPVVYLCESVGAALPRGDEFIGLLLIVDRKDL